MTRNPDMAMALRRSHVLSDPVRLCRALGLDEKSKRQSGGLVIRCPWHGENHPSCSVTVGPDQTVRVKCFACEASADALGLIEQTMGCRSFADTIDAACDIAGCARPSDDETHAWTPPKPSGAAPRPGPSYPWSTDVERLWGSLGPVTRHHVAAAMLARRAIDPEVVDTWKLAGVITGTTLLPDWARYRGDAAEPASWAETGHILVLPAYDHETKMRSVRAWRVFDDKDTPKRLPPAGCKQSGLVQANTFALQLLRGELGPTRVVIAEGEPDFLVWAVRFNGPVIGIGSGAWNADFAKRIPFGSTLILRTDRDEAGERYARQITKTCEERCQIRRAV